MTTRITQQVGASFGTAIVAVALQSQLAHGATSAFQGAFWWAAGITVAAIGRETPLIKQVAVSDTAEGPFIKGTAAEVQADKYPYGRYLYFYARREADGHIDPVAKDYLELLLSKEGQEIIASQADGYIPLNATEVAAERAKLAP